MSPSMAGKTSMPVKKANQSTAIVSFVGFGIQCLHTGCHNRKCLWRKQI